MSHENAVFVSYAHGDEPWKDLLLVQLRALGQAVPLDVWDDRRIKQGDDWYQAIKEAMARARFAICLISGRFLGSSFCMEEEIPDLLRKRQAQGLDLLPILIEDCPWEAHLWLKRLQMLPRDGKTVKVDYRDHPETVFSAVARRIYEVVKAPAAANEIRPALPTSGLVDTHRLPQAASALLGRRDEIRILIDALTEPQCRLVVFHGWGGVGKSTLLRAWADSLGEQAGALSRPVYAGSFANQSASSRETSADSLAIAALRFFGDGAPTQGLPWEKGERLAGLVGARNAIVLLDGLEPLQDSDGRLRDPIVLSFLRQLMRQGAGLCVVTSRIVLADFAGEADTARVQQLDVEEVSPSLGRALLRSRGVDGKDEELESTVQDLGGQALAIDLWASLYSIGGASLPAPASKVPVRTRSEHIRSVLAKLAEQLGSGAEVGLLRTLALFDRSVAMPELDTLLAPPALPGATELLDASHGALLFQLIQRLRKLHLITVSERDPVTIDMHPLVRRYFIDDWSRAAPQAFVTGHQRLYHLYRGRVPAEPRSVDDFEKLFSAIDRGCQGGLHQEAYRLYQQAARARGQSLLPAEHGLIGLELSALAGFFTRRWSEVVPELPLAARMDLLHRVSECLQAQGRVAEAEAPLLRCLEQEAVAAADHSAAETAQRLSTVNLVLGDLSRARVYSQRSVEYAADQPADERTVYVLARHGDILQLIGEMDEAEPILQRAEALNAQLDPAHPQLHGVPSFWICDWMLAQAERLLAASGRTPEGIATYCQRLDEVQRRAMTAAAHDLDDPFAVSLHQLCIGRTMMLQALVDPHHRLADAAEPLDRCINGLRQSGRQHWLPRGLLARAALRRESGWLVEAQADIAEALEIAQQQRITPMRLHIADCLIEQARLDLAGRRFTAAVDHYRDARTLVDRMRYHCRDRVLTRLEGELSPWLQPPSGDR
jgi:tetratricopeptide (TPR) repeat protein